MGQYADQLFLDCHHRTVEDIMEVLLDIALTILGTLGQGHQPGKAPGRLHTPKEIALVAVDAMPQGRVPVIISPFATALSGTRGAIQLSILRAHGSRH